MRTLAADNSQYATPYLPSQILIPKPMLRKNNKMQLNWVCHNKKALTNVGGSTRASAQGHQTLCAHMRLDVRSQRGSPVLVRYLP